MTRTAPMSDDLLSPMFAKQLLADFVGELDQVPPAFSAISVDGVRSYKRARAGEDVELPARTIEVYSADLVSIDEVDGHAVWTASFDVSKGTYIRALARDAVWTASFDVSKGTYIRALARDIGRAAGNAAHIVDLRRTASGPVGIGSCLHVEDLDKELARASALDPASIGRAAGNAAHIVDLRRTASGPVGIGSCLHVEDLDKELARASALDPASVLGYPARELSDAELADVLNGKAIACAARDAGLRRTRRGGRHRARPWWPAACHRPCRRRSCPYGDGLSPGC